MALKFSVVKSDWFKVSLILCVFGFLKELRPSEPFIYEFLTGSWKNITEDEVLQEVYPVGIYSYLTQLIIVFLITDLTRYKPLIIILGLAGVTVWGMLIWTKTLLELQILEIFYGTFMAAEVAYYTYIYAKVPSEFYPQVTSHTRAAILAGRFISGVIAQLLVSFDAMDYEQLNYISFGALIAATIWSLLLPPVPKSIYFHQNPEMQTLTTQKYKNAFALMKKHFLESFSRKYVGKWSIWWALSTCGFIQVQSYIQPLWSEIQDMDSLYNGAVEAILTLIGCLGALGSGYLKIDWKHKGELILSVCSIVQGALMLLSSQTESVYASYACYIVFGGFYHFVVTIATSEIAKYIMEDSYGLVFGLNTLVALVLQTLITITCVTGDIGWALAPREQFLAYGFYHLAVATIFIVIGLIGWFRNASDVNKTY